MYFLGILGGFFVAIMVGFANGWAQLAFGFDLTNLLFLVLPMGAVLVGVPSGYVMGFVGGRKQVEPTWQKFGLLAVAATAAGVLTMLSYHWVGYSQLGFSDGGMSFLDYQLEYFRSYSLSYRGSDGASLGGGGTILGYAEYVASALGALGALLPGLALSRTVRGVDSVPQYYDAIAELLVTAPYSGQQLKKSELTMARKGLALTIEHWFTDASSALVDEIDALTSKKIDAYQGLLNLQPARPLEEIVSALPKRDKTLSLLISAALFSVAAADSDFSPEDELRLKKLMPLLGLAENDFSTVMKLGVLQALGQREAINQAAPERVMEVQEHYVLNNHSKDPTLDDAHIGAIGLVRSEAGNIYRVFYTVQWIPSAADGKVGTDTDVHYVELSAAVVTKENPDGMAVRIESFRIFGWDFDLGQRFVGQDDTAISATLLEADFPDAELQIGDWLRKGPFVVMRLEQGQDSFVAKFPGADRDTEVNVALKEYENRKSVLRLEH